MNEMFDVSYSRNARVLYCCIVLFCVVLLIHRAITTNVAQTKEKSLYNAVWLCLMKGNCIEKCGWKNLVSSLVKRFRCFTFRFVSFFTLIVNKKLILYQYLTLYVFGLTISQTNPEKYCKLRI